MDEAALQSAHEHSWRHRSEIEKSGLCGCFFCLAVYRPAEIEEWIDEGTCAMCPRCGIDAVIGEASGLPVSERAFLAAMRKRWFDIDASEAVPERFA
jgi:hypothetical protein